MCEHPGQRVTEIIEIQTHQIQFFGLDEDSDEGNAEEQFQINSRVNGKNLLYFFKPPQPPDGGFATAVGRCSDIGRAVPS
jgi:hypothetical protein